MRKYMAVLFVIITFSFFINYGCGGSKKTVNENQGQSDEKDIQDNYDEIERLLGITNSDSGTSDQNTTAQKGEGNDDLIQLLEVDEGKKKETGTEEGPSLDKRVLRLKKQVEQMQKDMKQKDIEIADLRAQLMTKDEEIKNMENQAPAYQGSINKPRASSSHGTVSGSYVDDYENALSLFHQHRYRDALNAFEDLLARDMNNKYSDNAQYWIGECQYALGRYREAILAFEKVFTFRFSNKNDYAQFKIGQCYYQLGQKERARQEFQNFLDNYPESELNSRARQYLAEL
jgi:TolA-binding protein